VAATGGTGRGSLPDWGGRQWTAGRPVRCRDDRLTSDTGDNGRQVLCDVFSFVCHAVGTGVGELAYKGATPLLSGARWWIKKVVAKTSGYRISALCSVQRFDADGWVLVGRNISQFNDNVYGAVIMTMVTVLRVVCVCAQKIGSV